MHFQLPKHRPLSSPFPTFDCRLLLPFPQNCIFHMLVCVVRMHCVHSRQLMKPSSARCSFLSVVPTFLLLCSLQTQSRARDAQLTKRRLLEQLLAWIVAQRQDVRLCAQHFQDGDDNSRHVRTMHATNTFLLFACYWCIRGRIRPLERAPHLYHLHKSCASMDRCSITMFHLDEVYEQTELTHYLLSTLQQNYDH